MKDLKHPFIESIKEIEKKIDELTRLMKLKSIKNPENTYLDNAEFIQFLKISVKTAQKWRDKGIIAYSQPDNKGKIYYRLSDIQEFLNRYHKPIKKKA